MCTVSKHDSIFRYEKVVYSEETLMNDVVFPKRYIDDGAGFFNGSASDFGNRIN